MRRLMSQESELRHRCRRRTVTAFNIVSGIVDSNPFSLFGHLQ